ncbi:MULTISPECIES: HNH endonuclease [Nocardia]|uniref:HNH endonuclease n=1 Tax=Nocardia TaxID=1817 RepID=UPI000D69DFAE|nr:MULTISPECIES: HNH endonuclease signature motif containing protein [Nocardia]
MTWGTGGTRTVTAEYRHNRALALERDKQTCQLGFDDCTGHATEVDHILNFARQGGDDLANLQSVCAPCHAIKTAEEARIARAEMKKAARHPDSLRPHPGYVR